MFGGKLHDQLPSEKQKEILKTTKYQVNLCIHGICRQKKQESRRRIRKVHRETRERVRARANGEISVTKNERNGKTKHDQRDENILKSNGRKINEDRAREKRQNYTEERREKK